MPVDIMIVGAQKSGTTSLLSYLGSHPAIEPQLQREMTWFTDTDARPFPEALYFGPADPAGLRLGKLAGLMYQPEAIARLAAHNPRVEVVAILRDPVDRAYSSFWHMRGRGHEHTVSNFEQAIARATERPADGATAATSYLEWSNYEHSVRALQDRFGDAFAVLIFEEFISDSVGVTLPLMQRWSLDASVLRPEVSRQNPSGSARSRLAARLRRTRAARLATRVLPSASRTALRQRYVAANLTASEPPPMDADTERALRDMFREPNRRLEELLGRPIDVWAEPGALPRSASSQPRTDG